jgi:hypothetical protein
VDCEQKRMLLQQAITFASLHVHDALHQCRVPNAILTKVRFQPTIWPWPEAKAQQ